MLNELAGLGHEDDPVLLDQHKQARTGPDAEFFACFLGNDDLVLAIQCDRGGHGSTVK